MPLRIELRVGFGRLERTTRGHPADPGFRTGVVAPARSSGSCQTWACAAWGQTNLTTPFSSPVSRDASWVALLQLSSSAYTPTFEGGGERCSPSWRLRRDDLPDKRRSSAPRCRAWVDQAWLHVAPDACGCHRTCLLDGKRLRPTMCDRARRVGHRTIVAVIRAGKEARFPSDARRFVRRPIGKSSYSNLRWPSRHSDRERSAVRGGAGPAKGAGSAHQGGYRPAARAGTECNLATTLFGVCELDMPWRGGFMLNPSNENRLAAGFRDE